MGKTQIPHIVRPTEPDRRSFAIGKCGTQDSQSGAIAMALLAELIIVGRALTRITGALNEAIGAGDTCPVLPLDQLSATLPANTPVFARIERLSHQAALPGLIVDQLQTFYGTFWAVRRAAVVTLVAEGMPPRATVDELQYQCRTACDRWLIALYEIERHDLVAEAAMAAAAAALHDAVMDVRDGPRPRVPLSVAVPSPCPRISAPTANGDAFEALTMLLL